MTFAVQPNSRRPVGRGLVLLVLLVLGGVLGMHGLAPGPVQAAGHEGVVSHQHVAAVGAGPEGDCSHTGDGSGHAEHADATCAATGVASAYVPPALPAALTVPDATFLLAGAVPEGAVSGRAPPDLSELQLLRI